MIASDLIPEVRDIAGGCDDARALSLLSDAIELLTIKGDIDPLQRRVILPVTNGLISLPPDAEVPLAASIDGTPAFARSRLYEYDVNGPGLGIDRPTSFSFVDDMESPFFVDPVPPFRLHFTGDPAVAVRVEGTVYEGADEAANPFQTFQLTPLATDSPLFSRVFTAHKLQGVSTNPVTIMATETTGPKTVARYSVRETNPMYRKLRVHPRAQSIRLLYRARTYRLNEATDFIPVNSRRAVLEMVRHVYYSGIQQPELAAFYEASAFKALSDEQTRRNAMLAVAAQTQAASAIGLNLHAAAVVTVADVYDAFAALYPGGGRDKIFDRIFDAVETLANVANWNPLQVYVVLGVQNDYFVSLPSDIEDVIRATIEDEPAFARTRLYQFDVNGPGSTSGARDAVGYESAGEFPTFVQPTGDFRLRLGADSAALLASGEDVNGLEIANHLLTEDAANSPLFRRLDSVIRDPADVTGLGAKLYASPGSVLLATISSTENALLYRRLRLHKKAKGARLLCRKRTNLFKSFEDVIPLHSKMAVTTMGRALAALAEGNVETYTGLSTTAIELISREQATREQAEVAAQDQEDTSLGISIHSRDVVVVGDVMDDASKIYGKIGQRKLLDAIWNATEILQNASAGGWDSQLGHVDIVACNTVATNPIYTLPREVDEPIAVSVNGRGAELRNRWMQFHLNSCTASDCTPCGMWEKLPDTFTTINDIDAPVRLVARLASGVEEVEALRIFGTDVDGNEIYSSGKKGIDLPVHVAGFDPTTLGGSDPEMTMSTVAAISRVLKTKTTNFVELLAIDPATKAILYTLGYYYPDQLEPTYRRIRVPGGVRTDVYGTCTASIRVAFRRRQEKFETLNDVIFLRSRMAIVEMLRANKLRESDLQSALLCEQSAVMMLSQEQAARNPGETVTIQVDESLSEGVWDIH